MARGFYLTHHAASIFLGCFIAFSFPNLLARSGSGICLGRILARRNQSTVLQREILTQRIHPHYLNDPGIVCWVLCRNKKGTVFPAALFGYAGDIAVLLFFDLSFLFDGQLWFLLLLFFSFIFFTCFSHFDLSLLILRSISFRLNEVGRYWKLYEYCNLTFPRHLTREAFFSFQ